MSNAAFRMVVAVAISLLLVPQRSHADFIVYNNGSGLFGSTFSGVYDESEDQFQSPSFAPSPISQEEAIYFTVISSDGSTVYYFGNSLGTYTYYPYSVATGEFLADRIEHAPHLELLMNGLVTKHLPRMLP